MKSILLIVTLFSFPLIGHAESSNYYEECILKNLDKARTDAAVAALKETCASETQRINKLCESKTTKDLTNEELCACLGNSYDSKTKKCISSDKNSETKK
jgi:hypothetical protein